MNISIRRFLSTITAVVSLCALMTAAAFWYINHSSEESTEALVKAVESVAVTHSIQVSLTTHRRQALMGQLITPEQRRVTARQSETQLRQALRQMHLYVSMPEEVALVEKVEQSTLQYMASYHDLLRQGFRGSQLYRQVTDEYDRAQENIQLLVNFNLQETQQIEKAAFEKEAVNNAFMAVVLLLLAFVMAALLVGFRHLFFQPILQLKRNVDHFDLGDTSFEEKVKGSTEVQSIARSFSRLSRRLSKQKEQQLTFLSSIAHDLRNPLGAIKMSADLILDDVHLNKDHKELLSVIGRQSDHLKRLVEDLLDTTRIESGHMELDLAPCDLKKVIFDSALLHRNLSDQHSIELQAPEEPVFIFGDEQRITQVVHNLLNNAIKYSPSGGKIQVNLSIRDQIALVSISDEGVGISSENLQRIFEPFHRPGSTRSKIPGVGLGLSVSKKIISGHLGGELLVSSVPNQGSTFTLKLNLLSVVEPKQQRYAVPPEKGTAYL